MAKLRCPAICGKRVPSASSQFNFGLHGGVGCRRACGEFWWVASAGSDYLRLQMSPNNFACRSNYPVRFDEDCGGR